MEESKALSKLQIRASSVEQQLNDTIDSSYTLHSDSTGFGIFRIDYFQHN